MIELLFIQNIDQLHNKTKNYCFYTPIGLLSHSLEHITKHVNENFPFRLRKWTKWQKYRDSVISEFNIRLAWCNIYNQQNKNLHSDRKTSIHTQDKTNASHHILAKSHKEKTIFFFGRRFSLKTDFYTRFEMILSCKRMALLSVSACLLDVLVFFSLMNAYVIVELPLNPMNKLSIYQTENLDRSVGQINSTKKLFVF